MMNNGIFLRAHWQYLAMLNYDVDPRILAPYVPARTELDSFEGRTLVSMVGFRFLDTKVMGVSLPGYRDFEEINLRLYVRHRAPEGWRRGVVFIKEIVPRAAIAFLARVLYGENYVALPTRYALRSGSNASASPSFVSYEWQYESAWHRLSVVPQGEPRLPGPGSEPEFIAEHYWGYTSRRDGATFEYRVEHPPWRVWSVSQGDFECDVGRLYGSEFVEFLSVPPSSAFLAEGSLVTVYRGRKLG